MCQNRSVPIGKIVGVHGIEGIIKVISYEETLSVFKTGSRLLLKKPEGSDDYVEVLWVNPYKKWILIALKGIENRNQAEELKGGEFYIQRSQFPELESGTYYWIDMIGLSVFTIEEKYIGRVESIFPTGSNDVYVVKNKDKEILIPVIESVVVDVNIDDGLIRVNLPEGLAET